MCTFGMYKKSNRGRADGVAVMISNVLQAKSQPRTTGQKDGGRRKAKTVELEVGMNEGRQPPLFLLRYRSLRHRYWGGSCVGNGWRRRERGGLGRTTNGLAREKDRSGLSSCKEGSLGRREKEKRARAKGRSLGALVSESKAPDECINGRKKVPVPRAPTNLHVCKS